MYNFTRTDIDLDTIRARLAKMSDADLLAHGRAAEFMASRSTRETWEVQLREARGEWRRRHQGSPKATSAHTCSRDTAS